MTTHPIKSVVFLTPFLDDNSLGRTYSLWLLARQLGWSSRVISFEGNSVWAPLAGTEFGNSCELLSARSRRKRVDILRQIAEETDVMVAVKPLPQSLGLALRARSGNPFSLVADIDDPDLEARLNRKSWRSVAWRIRYLQFWLAVRKPKRLARKAAITVSNPTLELRHGGAIVPHVREDSIVGSPHTRAEPIVAFVGTVRAHKGVETIRDAVAQVADRGVRLVVTAEPPEDAKPWESWVGNVAFATGMEIVSTSDIVVIPSSRNMNAVGQLPVKLVDAMLLGRGLIVSDVDPMPWAVGESGCVVAPGDTKAIAAELLRLTDPVERELVGATMRARALKLFTVEAVAPKFLSACETARSS